MKERTVLASCPFYKRIPSTSFLVDAFQHKYTSPKDPIFFLSHFHADHYGGLSSKFSDGPIYCSEITCNLVRYKLKVKSEYLNPLPMNTPVTIQTVVVTLLDAHHCPGSVLFLFSLPGGQNHLHTGDFRYNSKLSDHQFCGMIPIHNLFLDTTYCDPLYAFPPQDEAIRQCLQSLEEDFKRPDTVVAVGSYTIGKEKLFISMAQHYNCKVFVNDKKFNILSCLNYPPNIFNLFTKDREKAKIHVLSMFEFSFSRLALFLKKFKWPVTRVIAVKPTGWTYKGNNFNRPSKHSNPGKTITVLEVPYSEHSSFTELKEFVSLVKARFIIPTVNNTNSKEVELMLELLENRKI
eukprot:TRINITY_DN4797_c0_g1_i1.p1 TRINITY_DN4797_c0_g1~~TRINITY_DN4797_c0_g1_i1.p1  ORF type:complete len:349 (-),score=51.96 TRINITY_DN4797_c0_g1_i1:214-1260(-)